MTTPAPSDRRRRAVVVAALAAVLVVLGASACGRDGGVSASDDGEGRETTTAATSPSAPDSASTSPPPPTSTSIAGTPEPAATVPGVPGEVTGPVPLDATVDVGAGVAVRLSHIEAVDAEAHLPGEASGPAVAVTVEIVNGSGAAIDLDHVTVDLATPAGASASPVLDPDRAPIAGSLDAGGTRSGSYVFTLGLDERDDVSVRVRCSVDSPTVVFAGGVPHG